jgi:hypothetical protein
MRILHRLRAGRSAPVRLGAFAAVLAVVFGAAAALGAAVHPGRPSVCSDAHGATMSHEPLGLAVAQDDAAIAPAAFAAVAGRPALVRFRIVGRDGATIRSGFQVEAERRMHVIVVRRDLTGYQHLHPTQAADGSWTVALQVPQPGAYRLFADFQRSCAKHVLAADLLVPGSFEPVALPAPSRVTSVDGYSVRLEAPPLRAGREAELRFSVSRNGRPVRGVEPYLGARGHLVALRAGDLAYLHVHPEASSGAPDRITFAAAFPSAGSYRLFLQFRVAGTVHTAALTTTVSP